MVQAMINISKNSNQVLNIVKARFNLKDKSEAIEKVVLDYGGEILEPELRPEFIQKIKRIEQEGKFKTFGSIDELRKDIENA
jgi:predicted rRNA methylase YqxC with S4 and FtsJ domains